MVMKNGDVYFTTLTTNIGRQVRLKMMDESVPYVPVKIDGICGQEIRGKSLLACLWVTNAVKICPFGSQTLLILNGALHAVPNFLQMCRVEPGMLLW